MADFEVRLNQDPFVVADRLWTKDRLDPEEEKSGSSQNRRGLSPNYCTYHHCHASAEDLTRRVAAFETRLNQDPLAIADRLGLKTAPTPTRRNCASQ